MNIDDIRNGLKYARMASDGGRLWWWSWTFELHGCMVEWVTWL